MYSITLAILLVAIFLWYNTSHKVKFSNRAIWFEKLIVNKKRIQIIASILALVSLFLTVNLQGLGAGIFAWLVYSMGFLSMVVLLLPYQYIKYYHVFLVFALILICEITTSYILTP